MVVAGWQGEGINDTPPAQREYDGVKVTSSTGHPPSPGGCFGPARPCSRTCPTASPSRWKLVQFPPTPHWPVRVERIGMHTILHKPVKGGHADFSSGQTAGSERT